MRLSRCVIVLEKPDVPCYNWREFWETDYIATWRCPCESQFHLFQRSFRNFAMDATCPYCCCHDLR